MKVIEKAFRRAALKCHPDKGGDPVVFKKINDAYNKLIGHVQKVVILKLVHMSVHPKLIKGCVCVLIFFFKIKAIKECRTLSLSSKIIGK